MSHALRVLTRKGTEVEYNEEVLKEYVQKLSFGLDTTFLNIAELVRKISSGVCAGMTTDEILNLAAETAADMTTHHPDYSMLAGRITVSLIHSHTPKKFSEAAQRLCKYRNEEMQTDVGLISEEINEIIQKNKEVLDAAIVEERDFTFSYFGVKTLERSYLLRANKKVVERPQYLWMRVAVGIHKKDIESAIETYSLMSTKHFVHATPTLFNSGTVGAQFSSCFLLTMKSDSIEGIFDTLKQSALISRSAGGIGISIHCIRSTNSYIRGTFGYSNGIIPMLRVFDAVSRYVDQGGNKRPGSVVVYLEPWHPDVFQFLDLKKNTGKEEMRARNLFLALWVPDLFMQRVENDESWSLFCPDQAPGLHEVYGDAFVEKYVQYEREGKARRTVQARALWRAIVEAEIETGVPYILYKDSCNRKSNQKNLGTIQGSNLCAEIVQYTSPNEIAVCNLASIALPTYLKEDSDQPVFDFERLRQITKVVVKNLNKIIDGNKYPVPEAKYSNLKHRPIGVGVQGLADLYIRMGMPFESEEALELNRKVFETIYFGAVEASVDLAEKNGCYESFKGSPASQGLLQFDLWGVKPSGMWNWAGLKARIAEHGLRNSLLVALMPTASTSQILGFNECFEGFTSNVYTRRTLSGEFQIVNPYLIKDLADLGLWSPQMKNLIVEQEGSISAIPSIPDNLKRLYKTVWEIKQKAVIDQAADRGAYVDQSQSMNIHLAAPDFAQITSMHFYGWKKGLKTGAYYLRTKPAQSAIKFTVDKKQAREALETIVEKEGEACPLDGSCQGCGS